MTERRRVETARMLGIGFVSGVAGGLLGIGGGGVMVPMLVAFVGMAQRTAHAVSLGAVVPLALAAALTYGAGDEVELDMALYLFAGGAVGAPLGAYLLSRADDRLARRAFGVLLVVTSAYLFLS